MSDQTTTNTSATSQNQGGEAGQQGSTLPVQQQDDQQQNGTSTDEGGQGGEGQGEAPAAHKPDPEKVIGRLTQRLGKTTAEKHAYRQRIAELEAQLGSGRAGGGGQADLGGDEGGEDGGSGEARLPASEVRRQAAAMAQEHARITNIATKVGTMLEAGKSIPNFNVLSAEVGAVLPVVNERGMPTPFIEAVVECRNAAEVMAHLGANPDLVDELADLTPRQQERRIVELSAELKHAGGAKNISRAPKPLEPVKGRTVAGSPAPRTAAEELAAIRASR